jgi:hypothetical protein
VTPRSALSATRALRLVGIAGIVTARAVAGSESAVNEDKMFRKRAGFTKRARDRKYRK